MRIRVAWGIRAALIALSGALATAPISAHKPVTSRYTFSEDVYPIFKAHCGGCHVPGGIAPMSLLTYDDARPWAESIRLELTAGRMPPWYGDPGAAPLRDIHAISPRDLDVVLTWVTGGTPPGPPMKPAPAAPSRSWARGRPDVVFQMPAQVTLPAEQTEETREIVLREDNERDRMIAFADLRPGNPSIVHDAVIFSRRAGTAEPSSVFAVWVPAATPVLPASGFGFAWRAHEQLVVRVHYKKTWKLERKAASDRSSVGLYLAAPNAREIRGIAAAGTNVIGDRVRALAVRVTDSGHETPVRLEAIRPDGTRLTLAAFLARPGWDRRYWLARPIDLPKGTRLELRHASAVSVHIWLDASTM